MIVLKPSRLAHHIFPVMVLLLVLVSLSLLPSNAEAQGNPPPGSVTVAGTLQSVLGCPGDWQPECELTFLTYDADDDLWTATWDLPPGDYEYKAALNASWDENYGAHAEPGGDNIPLSLTEETSVTFFFDHKTGWITDSVNSVVANVPGDFQSEIGCPGDWQPDCLRTWLQDPDGDGVYTFSTVAIPAGDYEAKVALNQSWEPENYGLDGVEHGPNIPFSVPADGHEVVVTYDSVSHQITISVSAEPSEYYPPALETEPVAPPEAEAAAAAGQPGGPDTVTIAGTIQSVLGCPGDWQPECELTFLTYDPTDALWMATWDLPAGSYEYKAALNGSWEPENYGANATEHGPNIQLTLEEDSSVTFFYDHATHWVTDSVNSLVANVPGDFQSEIGCPDDWQPDCLRTWLQDPDGDGVYEYKTFLIPPGDYEAKVALNQSWEPENYGLDGVEHGPNIPFSVPAVGHEVTFTFDAASHMVTVTVSDEPVATAEEIAAQQVQPTVGDLGTARAHWVTADTLAWQAAFPEGSDVQLHYSPDASLVLGETLSGGEAIPLTYDPDGLSDEVLDRFPHLAGYSAYHLREDELARVPDILKGQVALSAVDAGGQLLDATSIQIPGVLDELYRYDGELGVIYEGETPSFKVWAPTAQEVTFHLFDDADPETSSTTYPMTFDPQTGVWSLTGEADWTYKYYLYEVVVFAPTTGRIEHNLVTDPYSVSLSMNSQRSQIVDLYHDAALAPSGWGEMLKPALDAPEDIVLYELHLRDFSANDATVPEALRGTYLAFTQQESDGMRHLRALAEAGLTHVHLLPVFDIASINENEAERVEPDAAQLASFPPDSDQQQAIISAIRDEDAFNWGYDPYHYNVPEGSYATDPNGTARIVEFRQMVMGLNEAGLRVVMDVVYNHTNASGQNDNSVLDKIVPGYYHRLSPAGRVETSTCCQNTATEHAMMRKLMVDSVRLWAEQYGINAFRFDLMGHHMKDDMLAVRAALDEIDPSIYVYGEGWDFGEVAANARGTNATQANMAGTGIGVFNDRLRDSARGGSPFGGQQEQGFITGLYVAPNEIDQGTDEEQLARLLLFADRVRVGLAGNLAGYEFTGASGETVTGADIDYNGSPAGYTVDPQENIVYVSKHDNETLFDAIQYKAPADVDLTGRVRMQNLGNSLVMLSQGVPFFQAGDDLLRSKSLDRNSYNSGDWFNAIDWSGGSTNWGRGLPPAADNESMWPVMAPLLANPDLAPGPEHIAAASAHFREMAQIRAGSPLFRLRTAEDVQARLRFLNTGPDQIPGVIVMDLSDTAGENLDPEYDRIVVVFNADDDELVIPAADLAGREMALHPVLAASADPVVIGASWDSAAGAFTVPGRTAAVFVQPEGTEPAATPTPEPTATATPAPTLAPTAEPTSTPAPTATAVPVAVATAEAQPTPEVEATAETIAAEPPAPANGRSEITAVALLVIVGAVGAAAGIIAWLRGRKEE